MSERNGSTSVGPAPPRSRWSGRRRRRGPGAGVPTRAPAAAATPGGADPATGRAPDRAGDRAPTPRMPRRGPLTVMGPWAPVAGALLGLVLGVVAVLFLAGTAESFEDRLALVFTVLGLGMLGTSGVLLADEVRMIRQRARDAAVRPAWVEATAGLLNGLTPARLLLLVSALRAVPGGLRQPLRRVRRRTSRPGSDVGLDAQVDRQAEAGERDEPAQRRLRGPAHDPRAEAPPRRARSPAAAPPTRRRRRTG